MAESVMAALAEPVEWVVRVAQWAALEVSA